MGKTGMRIDRPFASYHRAELERMVQNGYEQIEARAVSQSKIFRNWGDSKDAASMPALEFQTLCAAEYYLLNTKGQLK
jgi:hypothetical protein